MLASARGSVGVKSQREVEMYLYGRLLALKSVGVFNLVVLW